MIPIIFDSNQFTRAVITDDTAFSSVINGLGVGEVSEAESCVVTEERNGGFTMTMTVPQTAKYLDQLNVGMLVCVDASPNQPRQLFEIVKVTKNLKGIFTIYAEHISYRLMYSILKPFSVAGLNNVFTRFSDNTNSSYYVQGNTFTFTWANFSSAAATIKTSEYLSVRNVLFGMEGSCLDKYGGCYRWNNFTVTLDKARGADNGVRILYGKNLTDITAEYNNSTQATANGVYPYCKRDDTTIGGTAVARLGSDITGLYTYSRVIAKDFTSDITIEESDTTATIQSKLASAATAYVASDSIRGVPDVNLKTSFVLLSDTVEYAGYANLESVEIDDTVYVYVPTLDVDVKSTVIKTNYNALLDRYNSVEVGNFKTTINQAIRSVKGV